MHILITGGAGFLGSALTEKLLETGHHVFSLSRHPPPGDGRKLFPLHGDILKPGLGISDSRGQFRGIDVVHHLAAIHRLGDDKDGTIWRTNVQGTINVINFCRRNDVPLLCFTSTAYTQGRNTYEQSKAYCETLVRDSGLSYIIFKPPIIMGIPQHFYAGHLSQFVSLLVKVHRRAEMIRRKVEGTLRLPVIEPVFRLKANPKGKINLIQVDEVVKAMVGTDKPGTYYLTHPDPPTVEEVVTWVGEVIMVRMEISYDFKPMPIEAMFAKLSRAFMPYLWGDEFPSHLSNCQPITKAFIQETLLRSLFGY